MTKTTILTIAHSLSLFEDFVFITRCCNNLFVCLFVFIIMMWHCTDYCWTFSFFLFYLRPLVQVVPFQKKKKKKRKKKTIFRIFNFRSFSLDEWDIYNDNKSLLICIFIIIFFFKYVCLLDSKHIFDNLVVYLKSGKISLSFSLDCREHDAIYERYVRAFHVPLRQDRKGKEVVI